MYENAQYVKPYGSTEVTCIRADYNGMTIFVPIDPDNTDYANMMALVAEGKLVIQPAD